jgi:hypothetical protein
MCILHHMPLRDHKKEDSTDGRCGKVTKIVVRKPKGKRPHGKAKHRWRGIMAL